MQQLLHYLKEKHKHFGVRRYTVNVGWMFFARTVSMITAFLATSYIARSLGPTMYGELSYALSFTALFGFIATLGIDQVLYREIMMHPEERNRLMGTAIVIRFMAGIVALITCLATAVILGTNGLSLSLVALISLTFILGSGMLFGQEFQADAESKHPSLLNVCVNLFLNVLKIVVIALGLGVFSLALVLVLEPILYIFGLSVLRNRRYGSIRNWRYDATMVRRLVIDSLPLMFVSAFYIVYARIDQVFIKHMIDTTSVGYYDAAVRLVEVWYFVPGIIITGLLPAIANGKKTNEELYFKRTKKLIGGLLVLTVVVAVVNTFLSDMFVRIVFGSAFAAAAPILTIYIWSFIGSAMVHISQQILILEKMTLHILVASILGMMSNVLLCLVWIPTYGLAGAAYSSVVSYLVPFLILFLIPKTRRLFSAIITS